MDHTLARAVTDLPITWQERVELILVGAGEIPACTVCPTSARSKWQEGITVQAVELQLDQIFKHARLESASGGGRSGNRLGVAKSRPVAQQIVEASQAPNDDLTYGRLSGYPDTAIRAFAAAINELAGAPAYKNWMEWVRKNDDISHPPTGTDFEYTELWHKLEAKYGIIVDDEMPPEVKNDESEPFVSFRLTRAHWQEEMAYPRRWARVIAELSPRLYKERVAK